jgi:hypothetical protein
VSAAFFYERSPSFLELPEGHARERVCGFLMLVEYREHIFIFKSGLDLPSTFKTDYLRRAGDDRVEAAIARADATFEQIRLRNMATSKYALRSKTLEANDLRTVVSPSGTNRYVPRGYRVRRGSDHYSATPNTGRISLRSDRAAHEDLINWGVAVVDMLIDENIEPSTFIRAFARPIDLDSMPAGVLPTYIAVDVPTLMEQLFDEPEGIRILRRNGDEDTILEKNEIDAILALLDRTLTVRKVRGELRITDPQDHPIGILNIGKTRISLRNFEIPEIENIYVEPANPPEGEDDSGVPIRRYIDQNDLFTILFSDLAVVYLDGALYRDPSLGDGTHFLSYLRTDQQLNAATSEKGGFTALHTAFDPDSVFGVVADRIVAQDEILICDDLGDEWADFIGINAGSQPKTISFYHAKHDDLTLGASALHVAVSQAIKNLGRINLAAEAIGAKLPRWRTVYVNDNVETRIQRVIRGDAEAIRETIAAALFPPIPFAACSSSRRRSVAGGSKNGSSPFAVVKRRGRISCNFTGCSCRFSRRAPKWAPIPTWCVRNESDRLETKRVFLCCSETPETSTMTNRELALLKVATCLRVLQFTFSAEFESYSPPLRKPSFFISTQ